MDEGGFGRGAALRVRVGRRVSARSSAAATSWRPKPSITPVQPGPHQRALGELVAELAGRAPHPVRVFLRRRGGPQSRGRSE